MLDLMGYSLLLLPFAFFWANCPCCSGCEFCDKPTVDVVINAPFGGDPECCDPLNGTIYTLSFDPDASSSVVCVWALNIDCGIHIELSLQEVGSIWRWSLSLSDGTAFVNASKDEADLDCEAEITGTVNPLIVAAVCATGVGGTFTINPPPP